MNIFKRIWCWLRHFAHWRYYATGHDVLFMRCQKCGRHFTKPRRNYFNS